MSEEVTGADLGVVAYNEWGSKGVPVFPCGADKRPLCKWGKKASTDKAEILRTFAVAGDRAVLIGAAMGEKAGLFALDFDYYKGSGAEEYREILKAAGILPDTRLHKTRSGGEHYIFFYPEGVSAPRNGVPYDGVEVRGEGGFIIVPPSPGYEVVSDRTTEAPEGLINRLGRARKAFNSLPIARLKQKIIQGESFHEAATLIAAKMSGAGKKPEAITAYIISAFEASVASAEEHPRHSRWKTIVSGADGELGRILGSAYDKFNPRKADDAVAAITDPRGRVDTGSLFNWTGADSHDPDAATNNAVPDADTIAPDQFPFASSYAATAVNDTVNKNFLVYPLIMESDVLVLSAAPKAGKTLTALSLCLHMAAGLNFGELTPLDDAGNISPVPVVYFALEGQGAIRKRVKGWLSFYRNRGITLDNIPLHIVEQPINLADEEAKQALVDKIALANRYYINQGYKGIGMVVFDTLTKAMPGKDQNSVEDTSSVFQTIDMMRESSVDCAVMFVHHNNKQGKGPRGSSNILAEPDTILEVEKLKPVVDDGVQFDCYQLDVFMARAVDDAQEYKMKAHVVDIGKNSQGIMENAPVLEVMDNYAVATTVDEAALKQKADKAKGEFYAMLYKVMSEASGLQMPMLMLHRKINTSNNTLASSYYSQHLNGNSREQVAAAWKVLLSDKVIPPALNGVSFSLDGTVVHMHLGLADIA